MVSPHDDDLNYREVVLFIIQNIFFFKKKLLGRLNSCQTFQNSFAIELFRSSWENCVILFVSPDENAQLNMTQIS